jgi:hypothetical protein
MGGMNRIRPLSGKSNPPGIEPATNHRLESRHDEPIGFVEKHLDETDHVLSLLAIFGTKALPVFG